jgi:hypothetical protein
MTDHLQDVAREHAGRFDDIDRKQLRFNEIVDAARLFYPGCEADGVLEMVDACSKSSALYVHKRPMWHVLRNEYSWMIFA